MKTDNELIAEFMGIERDKHSGLYDSQSKLTFDRCPNAPYDTSWDWLMPVVEKIESLGYNTCISNHSGHEFQITRGRGRDKEIMIDADFNYDTKLICVYKAVVEFIEWYNDQNP